MKVPFKYYLHDDYSHSERVEHIVRETGLELTEEQEDDLGRPFYEVTLYCELDTETMGVTLLRAEL